ncbi:hypothetical protein [Hyalangium gracile]|uniref:hypothetical protein n=1 Tax=Hyalangium gracile TaxID=394092 RepID=UPI001CCB745A|nr:hypothetical protein [Hyalangium gracile]
MRNTPRTEKSIERRESPAIEQQLMVSSGQLIEIGPDALRAVVGGRKPVVEITVKPDGTIVIIQK